MKTAAVLRLDPDLLGGMGEPRASRAVHACQAQVLELPQGPWRVDLDGLDHSGFGLLVLSGVLCRRVVQNECYGAELIGPGDVITLAGDLGTQLFDKVDLELDIAGKKFNLFASDHCPGRAVYWTKDYVQLPLKRERDFQYLRADVSLDGRPLTVSFSTDGRSRIGMDAMRRLFNIDETSPQLTAIGQDLLGRKTYRFAFKSLTADGLTVNNPDILVYDEAPRAECKQATHFTDPEDKVHTTSQPRLTQNFGCNDAVLGPSVLSKLRIYVSRQENLLYISAAGAN